MKFQLKSLVFVFIIKDLKPNICLNQMQSTKPLLHKQKTYKSICSLILWVQTYCISSIYFGYNVTYCSSIQISTIIDIYNIDKSFDQSVINGVLSGLTPVGGLLGALGSGVLIANFSRRNSILLVNLMAIISGFLIFVPFFPMLLIFRLCQGICVGFYSALVPLIVKQLSPVEVSGSLGTLVSLNVNLGTFVGVFISLVIGSATGDFSGQTAYPYVFAFPILMVVFQTMIIQIFYPYETSKYLIMNDREIQALSLIKVIYKQEYVKRVFKEKKQDVASYIKSRNLIMERKSSAGSDKSPTKSRDVISIESNPVFIDSDSEDSDQSDELLGYFGHIKRKKSKLASMISLYLFALQQFSGINCICVYGGDIVGQVIPDLKHYMGSMINGLQVLVTFFCSYLMARMGRKTILTYGALFEGLSIGCVSLGFFLDNSFGTTLIIVGLVTFLSVYGVSLGPVVFLYVPQIVQPKMIPYSTGMKWICCSLVVIFFPIITENVLDGNPAFLFGFFSLWCLVSFFINIKYLVETKGKNERQIRQQYANVTEQ